MTVTQTNWLNEKETMNVITVNWTADTGGAVESYDITGCRGMYLVQVETVPGNRPPTDNYDITLKDADGYSIVASLLANRDEANAEVIFPTQVSRPIDSNITMAISGNAVDRANGKVKLYLSTVPVAIVVAA